jgi:hypothetical protein
MIARLDPAVAQRMRNRKSPDEGVERGVGRSRSICI